MAAHYASCAAVWDSLHRLRKYGFHWLSLPMQAHMLVIFGLLPTCKGSFYPNTEDIYLSHQDGIGLSYACYWPWHSVSLRA